MYNSKELSDVIKKIYDQYHLHQDLKQELFLILCEKSEEFITTIHARNELKFYTVRILLNLTRSFSSPFYKKYCEKHSSISDDDHLRVVDDPEEYESFIENIVCAVGGLHWYKNELIKMYVEKGNLRAITKETGIPLMSVHLAIKQAKREVKNKVCG